MDERDRQLIRNLYLGQVVMVRVGSENSEPRENKKRSEARMSKLLSLLLFNICMQEMITEALENSEDGQGWRDPGICNEICK